MIAKDNFIIRPILRTDIAQLFKISEKKNYACSYIALSNRMEYSLSDYQALFDYISDGELVVHERSKEPCMYISYSQQSRIDSRVHIAILIDDEYAQNAGSFERLGDALNLFIDFVFSNMNLNKIIILLIEDDAQTIKLIEKSGFKHEVVFKKHYFAMGKYRDILSFGILRKEWLGVQV